MPIATKINELATVRLTRDEACALLVVANQVLCDGDNGIDDETQEQATRALRRMVECFGGKWSMNAGAVGSNLHREQR